MEKKPRDGRPGADEVAGQYRSDALFSGRREIVIRHRGHRYVLRITRQEKLILNKLSGNDDECDPKP